MRKMFAFLAAAAALTLASPAAAAQVVVTSGETTGVNGLDVGGTLYNVTFEEGSCATLFAGCVSSQFAFSTQASAALAGQALITLLSSANPETIYGCESSVLCDIEIPFAITGSNLSIVYAEIGSSFFFRPDSVNTLTGFPPDATTVGANGAVYARFTLASAAVPEPATWAMMLLGFGGIGFAVRRKRSSANLGGQYA